MVNRKTFQDFSPPTKILETIFCSELNFINVKTNGPFKMNIQLSRRCSQSPRTHKLSHILSDLSLYRIQKLDFHI